MPGVPQAPLRNGSTPVSRIEQVGQQPKCVCVCGIPTVGHLGERLGHTPQNCCHLTPLARPYLGLFPSRQGCCGRHCGDQAADAHRTVSGHRVRCAVATIALIVTFVAPG